ncbi:MAG: hypothetical protein ACO21H_02730 [Sediminibacterium sp.]
MDQALSSLFPIHQIGADGFNWWVGQVESKKSDDPKQSGRYRVRIVGQHLKDCDAVPTEELPWANVMMPVTTPYTDGLTTGASVGLEPGCWVLGFYLDNDKQKPIIMGSIGHTKYSTIIKNDDPNPGKSCKSFTTFTSPNVIPQAHYPTSAQSGVDKDTKANVSSAGPPAAEGATKPDGAPPILLAALAEYNETNPIGGKSCNIIANPKCGQEKNLKNSITNILGDLLAANQSAGGQLGDYYVGKVNGFLYDKVEIARYHISRITRLVRSFIARIKGEIIKYIRKGIDELIKIIVGEEAVTDELGNVNTGPTADPKTAFKPVKPKGNRLKTIKKIFDEIFKELGCTIEDLTDRIAQFITDLIFGYLSDLFYQATCAVDTIVQGILNEILALFDSLVAQILGPLQELLGILAAPLNLIGGILNKILSFLGISCSGPSNNCEAIQKKCTDCGQNKEDDLDRLIKAIEDGALDSGGGLCEESTKVPDPTPTEIDFIGGVFVEPPPTPLSEPVTGESTPESFLPGGTSVSDETFGEIDTPEDYDDPFNDDDLPEFVEDSFPDPDATEEPFYSVQANKSIVNEGETIQFTIRTLNVPVGTVLNYTLSGSNITTDDIVGGELTGSVTMSSNEEVVSVTIAEDDTLETVPEALTFSINGTEAQATVIIDSEFELVPGINENIVLTPAYSVTSDKSSYLSGENIVYTIITTNVDDGTELNYTLVGSGILPEFFVNKTLSGSFIIQDNTAEVVIGIDDNLNWQNNFILSFVINGTGAFVDVVLQAEEDLISGADQDVGVDEDIPDPRIDKPVAGTPITDENGAIISIPIISKGDAYQKAPQVIITGKGYGATGIALLDDKGFVSEIRVTRTGTNYRVNTPKDTNTQCIIDSFTLISPGIGYTSAPTVYINGQPNLAKAIVENGYVISVEILDRSTRYENLPEILIVGGEGAGAKVLPNLFCLDIEELERRGYAKIGTGKYIDCP